MSTALSIKGIDLHYGAAQALRGITIDAKPGKITAVLGRNGVGKSSTLRAVTGINNVSSGEIVFNNEVLKKAPPYKRARLGIGYVPQGREIFALLTVKENLETGYAPLKSADRNIPIPPLCRRNDTAFPMSLMIEGWMPSVGSSSTNTLGRVTSARPMASCCCWPPERSPPRRLSMDLRIGNSS